MWAKNKQPGFTIVELLIVIVVIGILAAITIVAYNGVQQRAVAASLTSDLNNATKLLKLFQVENSTYPATIDCAIADSATNKCLKSSNGTVYQYAVNNNASPQAFCVTAVKSNQTYQIANDGTPTAGDCLDSYGLVLDLDVGNTTSYPGAGTTWTDLSGSGNNGTLTNGPVYSGTSGGTLVFDGINDYVNITGNKNLEPQSLTVSAWINMSPSAPVGRNIFLTKWNGYSCEIEATTRRPYLRLAGVGDVYSSDNLVLGNWYQFVGVFDKGVGAKIYLNNTLKGSIASAASITYTPDSVLNVGRYAGGVYFNGSISDVRIYSRALSVSEIQQNFDALRGRYGL